MHVLVLSGGGRFGAWQAGAIRSLVDRGCSWDRLCGVSVGAINALRLAQYAPAAQRDGAESLVALWLSLRSTEDVYRVRFGDWLRALLGGGGGRYDDAPLRALLSRHYDASKLRASRVQLRVGFTDLAAGEYLWADENDPQLLDAVAWSAGFPVAVSPSIVRYRGRDRVMVDGGVRNQVPIDEVFAGAELIESIDVVCCQPPSNSAALWSTQRGQYLLDTAMRTAEVMASEILRTDLLELQGRARAHNPSLRLRVFYPAQPLVSDPLDFSPSYTRVLLDQGSREVHAALSKE